MNNTVQPQEIQQLTEALQKLRQKMVDDYNKSGFSLGYDVKFEFGRKFIKAIKCDGNGNSSSVVGFIVNTHNDKKFPFGTLLKAASWKAPATNFSRGSVFELDDLTIRWTGIQ